MSIKRVLRAVCIVLGVIFLLSILTVESHAHAHGSLTAKLPTIIDGTVEYAVTVNDKVELDVFRAIEHIAFSPETLSLQKSVAPPQINRGPPPSAF